MPKLALAIIAKDEVDQVKRIVSKYSKYFDEVAVAVDDKVDEFKSLENDKVKIHPYTWCDDFAHKRNFLADKIQSEYYFRMDSDDDIDKPEYIPELFRKVVDKNLDLVFINYVYAKDQFGNVVAEHMRETLIRKRADVKWNKAIHENILMEDPTICLGTVVPPKEIQLIHNKSDEDKAASQARNLKLLLKEYEETKSNPDPRTVAYIGRIMLTMGMYDRAINFLQVLVEKSGWDDDKYFAWMHMADAWDYLKNLDNAVSCCNEAMFIKPSFADAYFKLGEIYTAKKKYAEAIEFINIGLTKGKPKTNFVVDPSRYTIRPIVNLAMAYFGIGDYEKAYAYFVKAKKLMPTSDFILNTETMFQEALENETFFKNFKYLASYVKRYENSKIETLFNSIPKRMYQDERVWALKNALGQPKTWSKNSVVIFCGKSWEDWAAPSLLIGIGGSEEAVIYLSAELAKLGYEVTVFNSCGNLEGKYNNVDYVEYFKFNPRDNFNIVISWRHSIFDKVVNAKKKVVWLHDVPYRGQFTKAQIEHVNPFIVLSNYHKSVLPKDIKDDQIYVSSNGINIKDFNTEVEKNPKKIIYTSSYDRGIEHLLARWDEVLAQVPDAELHLYYGWDTWKKMEEVDGRDPRDRKRLEDLMKKKNVFEHGRIGHRQLAKELKSSGIWCYPSHFTEISCISAMKAQAAGCVPICTDFAALKETVKEGVKIEGNTREEEVMDQVIDKLVFYLKNPDKQEELRQKVLTHKEEFGWDKIAKDWAEKVFNIEESK